MCGYLYTIRSLHNKSLLIEGARLYRDVSCVEEISRVLERTLVSLQLGNTDWYIITDSGNMVSTQEFVSPEVTEYFCLDLNHSIRICTNIKGPVHSTSGRIDPDSNRTVIIENLNSTVPQRIRTCKFKVCPYYITG